MRRRVHLVGIGGAGLSAIARVLHERGDIVTGSDLARSAYTEALEVLGVSISFGHRAENVTGSDLVVVSSAIPQDNVEWQAALQQGIPTMKRAEFLPELVKDQTTIAVAGTHGKSTTSGLIAWLLDCCGFEPGFIVGGMLLNFGTNAKAGAGSRFVIEADEYDRTFLGLHPEVAVVTNVEHDHPDSYPTMEEFTQAFARFVLQVKQSLIVCQDDPVANSLKTDRIDRVTYGLSSPAHWRAEEIRPNAAGGMDFLVLKEDATLGLVRTRLPGQHNVLNALGALAAGDVLGLDFKAMREALTDFMGVGRRFEVLGEAQGVVVVDDYAHHPTEIQATLEAARQRYPEAKIWAVFQPHTFSRVHALLDAFAVSFVSADHVIVTEIFASREIPDGSIDGEQIAARIQHDDVHFISDLADAARYLVESVQPGAVVLTLSAGDGNRVGTLLLDGLSTGKGARRHV